MSNLVELMAKAIQEHGYQSLDGDMRLVLSVVKEHIGEVAQICPKCNGSGCKYNDFNGHYGGNCETCGGKRIIARTEGDV